MKWPALFSLGPNETGHLEKWLSGVGGLAGMLAVVAISQQVLNANGTALVVASMGASAVLLFAVPHGPLSQPWPVIGGHVISAVIGVACARWIPDTLFAASAAVALAIGAMHYLFCIHPPGGATALTAVVGGDSFHALGFNYVYSPVLLSAITIVIVAVLFNYAFPWRRYPASLANHRHQRKKPLSPKTTEEEDRLTRDDLESALKSMNRIIDISAHDLEEIYRLAKQNARTSTLDPMTIKLRHYYSNGHYGPFWQVRQIIDIASPAKSASDKVIYRIVAGNNLYSNGIASREDFVKWARYEVFQKDDAWLRLENSEHVRKQA